LILLFIIFQKRGNFDKKNFRGDFSSAGPTLGLLGAAKETIKVLICGAN
jgi:hypothetical protein